MMPDLEQEQRLRRLFEIVSAKGLPTTAEEAATMTARIIIADCGIPRSEEECFQAAYDAAGGLAGEQFAHMQEGDRLALIDLCEMALRDVAGKLLGA